jgi:hypothetical protein
MRTPIFAARLERQAFVEGMRKGRFSSRVGSRSGRARQGEPDRATSGAWTRRTPRNQPWKTPQDPGFREQGGVV